MKTAFPPKSKHSRKGWHGKPVGPVEIDWSNTLTKGLKFAHIFVGLNSICNTAFTASGNAAIQNQTLQITDASDYITCDDSAVGDIAGSAITVFSKQKVTGTTDESLIIDKSPTNANAWRFFPVRSDVSSHYTRFRLETTAFVNVDSLTETTQVVGESFTTAGTYDGAQLAVYIDGALSNTAAQTGNITTSGEALRIGGDAIGTNVNRAVEVVYIFDRALSASEIAALDKDPYQILKPTKQVTVTTPNYSGDEVIDWSNDYVNDLVFAFHEDGLTNPIDNTAGSLTGDAYFDSGLECDGTGDSLVFSETTRNNLAFGTDDFTIIVKCRYDTPTSAYPTVISNGDTAAGEWMLRQDSTNDRWSFYGDAGGINAGGATPYCIYNASDGEEIIVVAKRIGNTAYIQVRDTVGNEHDSDFDVTSTDDLNATSVNACLGGGDNNATRWWQGAIKYAYVWKGRGLTDAQVLDFITKQNTFTKPTANVNVPREKPSSDTWKKVYHAPSGEYRYEKIKRKRR